MVKVFYPKNSPARPRRGKGKPVVVNDPRGTFVRSAPRFNPTFKAYWRWWMRQEFSLAARWASNPEPMAYQTAIEMAKNTEYIPRDIIMMCSMGTYYTIVRPNGEEMEIGRMATSNVQYILGLLDPEVGAVISYRSDGWWALAPGSAGQVLTMVAGNAQWADPQGGGGGGGKGAEILDVFSAPIAYTPNKATVGNIISPWATINVAAIQARLKITAGESYQMAIAEYDTATAKLLEVPTYCVSVSAPETGQYKFLTGQLPSAYTMQPGHTYMVMVMRQGAGGTPAQEFNYTSTPRTGWGMKFEVSATAYSCAADEPSITDLWYSEGGGVIAVAPLYNPT